MNNDMTLDNLIRSLLDIHRHFIAETAKAVNMSLTLRNWLIGFYIEEYARTGVDRAEYGDSLMDRLADSLRKQAIPRCDRRELYRYRRFYLIYPHIAESLSPQFLSSLPKLIRQHLSAKPGSAGKCTGSGIVESVTPQSHIDGKTLISRLSFTHMAELLNIDDGAKRAFYEFECIRGNWSVRELKRQINSLYFERSGLSKNKKKLGELVQAGAEQAEPKLAIRDPYIFEFLGIKAQDVMHESRLEDSLLDKLQDFLLELGHGFCFEARQKRILIGDEHFFVDLVFYHRILKCHVLVELKTDDFTHGYLGQLNTYVNWFRKNEASDGDNPPVGILLCTRKNEALMEYALAGMDNSLFVSKYQLQLPEKEEIERFLETQLAEHDEN